MIIDMSQAAVNRTAMYYISHHIYNVLSEEISKVQYFGKHFIDTPSRIMLQHLQSQAFNDAFSDPYELLKINQLNSHKLEENVLYLDPLYVLFGGLKSSDTVFILDLSPVTCPHWHGHGVGKAYGAALSLIATMQPNVVAISQNTADTFVANYGFPHKKISVIPLYVPPHLTMDPDGDKFHSPEPYILFVGSLESRKNIVGALESFRLSNLGVNGYRFIIVGGHGQGAENVHRIAKDIPNVFFSGYASENDLRAFYRGAAAFIYPSYLEGFGVPLLEAMYFGIPSVASSTGACPEVGGPLMKYLDPDDHVGFASELVSLVNLTEDERSDFRIRARHRVAEKFSVKAFDQKIRNIASFKY